MSGPAQDATAESTGPRPGTLQGDPPPREGAGPGTTQIETPPTAVTVAPSKTATLALFTAIVLLLLSFVAPAGAATPRTSLEAVEAELMCVTCRTPLNQSNAPQALEERDQIERLVAQGKTKQQAIDAMVAIYGDPVLIDPPESGLRVARIAIPGVAAVFGITLLVVLIGRWRRRARLDDGDGDGPAGDGLPTDGGPDLDSSSSGLTDDDRRRLDAELERYA
ncbi:cytochrome c-type biogenesis protein [Patulibacter sp.]|uniref:cytochrome c-type biogenesis protein n=1 Tax=Patulibacter sp. TaxID=1912859 RepID=UPI00271F31D0|nr:cytochrome c-type biogenesis protein [Patulibacter sp.]MDO9409510.1 cytochrome c-type biogenesis protein CcmH [Patulibacter sp.]